MEDLSALRKNVPSFVLNAFFGQTGYADKAEHALASNFVRQVDAMVEAYQRTRQYLIDWLNRDRRSGGLVLTPLMSAVSSCEQTITTIDRAFRVLEKLQPRLSSLGVDIADSEVSRNQQSRFSRLRNNIEHIERDVGRLKSDDLIFLTMKQDRVVAGDKEISYVSLANTAKRLHEIARRVAERK